MLLLLKYWKAATIVTLVLALATSFQLYRQALVQRGMALERAHVADSILASNAKQLRAIDTVLVEKIVRVPKLVARLDTLRDTVLTHLTDTVVVKEYVEKTDSALKVCSALASDCATYRTLAEQRFAAYEAKIQALEDKPKRNWVLPALFSGMAGYALGSLAHRLAP